MSMNRYDVGPEAVDFDPAQAHIAAFRSWETLVHERGRIEEHLAMSYHDLVKRYREKCAECDREKRNAIVWEREQRMSEKELNSLKTAAVSLMILGCVPCSMLHAPTAERWGVRSILAGPHPRLSVSVRTPVPTGHAPMQLWYL